MEKEFRILVTGVGRRVELIQAFKEAATVMNVKLVIYGIDISEDAPATAYCDCTRSVCRMLDKNYIPELLQICKDDKIDLIIPTIDTDLTVLSENADVFAKEGTKVLISSPDVISICRDKNKTSDFFESCGLKTPKTVNDYRLYDGLFPCFIKPKDGSSSINAYKVNNQSELRVYAELIGDYIIQPYVHGVEYTVDIFCDFDGNPITVIPRIRVAVRGGEVLKTRIAMDEKIIADSLKIVEKFKPCGPLTVQLIRHCETDSDYYIEINPRFGGGSPLSMKAGARSAEMLLRLLKGEKIDAGLCRVDNGAVFSRFDQCVCIEQGNEIQQLKGVIFDLDDTLYSESDYVRSGFKAVAELLNDKSSESKLQKYYEEGKPAIDALLNEINKPELKDKCLEAYRNNIPDIKLYDGIKELLISLRANGVKVGIITDGRPEGQNNKIDSLGLRDLADDIIITDELGGTQFRKPNDVSFRIMSCRWKLPFEQIAYVGDNPRKDFYAPAQLGMKSIYFKNKDGLYSFDSEIKFTFNSVKDFSEFILSNI